MGDKRTLRPSVVNIVDEVSKLSLVDASELVKALERHLGVTARPAPAAITTPRYFGIVNPPEFSVWADAPGPNRKQMVMLLRERLGLSLVEAIAFADRLPGLVREGVDPPTADEWLSEFRRLGLLGKKIALE